MVLDVEAGEEGAEAGGGGRERYMMLWTEVMPEGETTVDTGPLEVEPPGLTGLRRAAKVEARGASGGGACGNTHYVEWGLPGWRNKNSTC